MKYELPEWVIKSFAFVLAYVIFFVALWAFVGFIKLDWNILNYSEQLRCAIAGIPLLYIGSGAVFSR